MVRNTIETTFRKTIRTRLLRLAASLAVLASVIATMSSAAVAQTAPGEPPHPMLKAQATVTGPIVRVGDLIDNAGIIANVAIFRAPDLGETGTVPAETVIEAVRAHQLIGLDTGGVSEVVVTRASRAIPVADIEATVARSLSLRYNLGDAKDVTVHFERDPRMIYVEPSAKGDPRVSQIAYDPRSGRFDAMLDVPTGAANHGILRLSGRAAVTAEVVTVSHNIERGALLKDSDLTVERRPRAEVGRGVLGDRAQIVGMAARNILHPGQLLRGTDLMKPELVQRNETVTLVYQVPGITLTVRGKATEGGAEGDVISVTNEQTKRAVQGVIVGPGRVVISTGSPRLVANLPPSSIEGR
ncbi:MAG: flagellar basal body P-ring formation protein FlgA [Rhodopseudomonas sp.]|nr:flagellar basal body P-ring formation protein FlgA [Rhodopseudomonas sp.]